MAQYVKVVVDGYYDLMQNKSGKLYKINNIMWFELINCLFNRSTCERLVFDEFTFSYTLHLSNVCILCESVRTKVDGK